MSNFTSDPCLLKDLNITYLTNECEQKDGYLYYQAKLTYTPKQCMHCSVSYDNYNIVKNGTRKSQILLLKTQGIPVKLVLHKQRYCCKACQHSFTASTDIVEKHCFISKRVKQMIAADATKIRSEQDIAGDNNVSPSTVRRIIDNTAKGIKTNFRYLPQTLSFDEFKSTKTISGSMSFIMVDPMNSQPIDIIENRRLKWLKVYFMKYPRYVRKKVKAIVIDNNYPYIQLIKELFPNAKIVFDRFHLVQAILRELSKIRVRTMKQFVKKDKPLYNKYKRYWKLIQMNRDRLNYSELKKFSLFKYYTSTGRIVDYLLEQDETLALNYGYIHDMYDAIMGNDVKRFEELIVEILASDADDNLKRVIKTFKKFKEYIVNTLSNPLLSNGPIEGYNNKIKVIKRISFGYRNYYHFRNRILLIMKIKPRYSKQKRRENKRKTIDDKAA